MASVDSAVLNKHADANGTSAQKLMQQHEIHKPTIEDDVDEADLKHSEEPTIPSSILEGPGDEPVPNWTAPLSAKAAGKRKEESPKADSRPNLDPTSEELFPVLGGGPKPVQPTIGADWRKQFGGASSPASTNGTTNGGSKSPAPTPVQQDPRKINIPGQVREDYTLQKSQILPRQEMKKPLPDILKDINRKSKKVTVTQSAGGAGTTFTATGPSVEAVRQALRDVVSQVGAKITEKVTIPQSTRAHIIGKAGSKIKEIQEKTGARIHIPKMEDTARPTDEDDDPTIEISVEGNALSVGAAQSEILKIASARTPPVNSKLRTIPAELYAFIAENEKIKSHETQGLEMRIPQYHIWKSQAPPQSPGDFQPALDDFITLTGERLAVQALKSEIERYVEELKAQVAIEQFMVQRARHQFVIGKSGMKSDDFFRQTGCAIILPHDEDEDEITIIGPSDRIAAAKNIAIGQASSLQTGHVDIPKLSRSKESPDSQRAYAQNLTQYLRQRNAVEQLEAEYKTRILTAGAAPWELVSRDYANISDASSEMKLIINAHPPTRIAQVSVDPFYHNYLKNDVNPKTKSEFGVHIVVPDDGEGHVILVFEGEDGQDSNYKVTRTKPDSEQVQAFKQGLQDAQKHILETLRSQAEISSTDVDVPFKFHDKLKRFIKNEMNKEREAGNIPVRINQSGTKLTIRGPKPAVETLIEKINNFVEQAIQDDKERGFTMSFDFPQKHANQLIGKGGSFINELREKFDVDIKVDDGKVELKGPKAKAEAAKSHISKLGSQWADEATHTLLVDPKFHRELIGQGGTQINKLQKKYNVQIHFPRSARPVKDDQSDGDKASETGKKSNRREQGPNEVIVKGPKKGADGAREEILELVQYLQDNAFTATVSVQQSQVPSLIGQGGKLMDELRTTTGARIDVPNSKEAKDSSGNVDVQIRGTKSQVAQAKKLIEEKKNVYNDTITKHLEVDKKHHRALIGGGGSKLREIVVKAGGSDDRRELARTVQFPKQETDGNKIKIEGSKDVVDKIITAMQAIITELENQTTETIDVPTDKHRMLIGRGGETKKDLESRFKVSLNIPQQGNGQTGVKIVGLSEDVEKAKAHILQLVKEQEGETVLVNQNVHHIISDNGQFFRRLQNNLQVTVNHDRQPIPPKPTAPSSSRGNGGSLPLITDDDEANADAFSWTVVQASDSGLNGTIPWVLRGSAENVAKAKATLLAAIEQASKNTSTGFLVLPDPSTYRFVIGQGGSKVNSIRKATGCKITVPRDQASDEGIEISGSADGIEKAKDLVLEAVKDGKSGGSGRA